MNDVSTIEDRIAAKLDTRIAGALQVSRGAGGISFSNVGEVFEFAKMLSISGVAVPKFLRGNPGACLGIVVQAIEWKLSPYSVANKAYSVNDRLAYEAQLVHAVILQRAPLKGRIKFEFLGEGAKRSCRAWAKIDDEDGEIVEYRSPQIGDIKVKNSPLWTGDPDQQLSYFSVRSLCRRHFPDVLLGIYTPEELYEADEQCHGPEYARDVTPKTLYEKLDALAAIQDSHDAPPPHEPETGDIISSGMAERAQKATDAMNDPTGEKATALLAERLEERTTAAETIT